MRVIRTIIFLLVCIGLIWLVVLLFASIFRGSNQTTVTTTTELSSYARTGTTAQLVMDGPVIINQDHRSVRITVESTQSKIELISGYDGSVVRQDVFPNTQESYSVFLRSLDGLGFTKGNKSVTTDERGQCPLQNRYVYKLTNNGNDVFRYWSTSCGTGSFGGVRASVRTLFQRQIPTATYNDYLRGLSLSS